MPEDRPNVLWITTDQQRFDTLGCYGNDWVSTPNLDELASRGVRFERAYCQSPVCTPSRASFLTGRYPRTTRCRSNGFPIPEEEVLVPRLLTEAGYRCGLSGKLHLSPFNTTETDPAVEEPARRIDDGYASFHWSPSPPSKFHAPTNEYEQWLTRQGVEFERESIAESEYATTSVPAEYHQTTWCVDRAVDFVETMGRREAGRPWLFSVNVFDPHLAFDPPEAYLEPYLDRLEEVPLPNYEAGELDDKPAAQRVQSEDDWFHFAEMDDADHRAVRAAYWAMVDLIDDQVGRLLDALDESGQRDETLVVFMSDHGELLGDHGMYTKGPFFYEPSVRVPLVFEGPGVAEGVETDALVELVDLAPTLLEAAGVDRPLGMQARSLWPLLRGEADEGRDAVYSEYYVDQHPASDDAEQLLTMVRTDRYKLVRSHATGEGELYDLDADPTETTNRWDDPEYAEAKTDLLTTLTDRMAETVDPRPEKQESW
ncbi:MAG: sulfatase [Halobacteriaceae archaeon]